MPNRRRFIQKAALGGLALSFPLASSEAAYGVFNTMTNMPKISLAQWSLHRAFKKGTLKAENFATISSLEFGIKAVEYVNQFYQSKSEDMGFWKEMKLRSKDQGVTNVLIMVDDEGELGNLNDRKRKKAVENHYKWVDAAKALDCHAIRVNAFGEGKPGELSQALTDGLGQLAEYGQKQNINILIENHGLHTSNAAYIVDIIKAVKNPFLGTLPDFGNWCMNAEWGSLKNPSCSESYDPFQGLKEFLPYAKGVSAKSYEFDSSGSESLLDYKKLLQLVKDTGFDGYIGIEYEGDQLSEAEGIRATKSLVESVWQDLK